MRRLVSLAVLAALSACNSYELDVNWTIEGDDAAAACSAFDDPTVRFTVLSRDSYDSRGAVVTETTSSAACDKGSAKVVTGPFARVLTILLDGDTLVGAASPVDVAPGAPPTGSQLEAAAITTDIVVTQSRLRARLIVAGKSCGDAGASTFTVTLLKNVAPLTDVVVDAVDVSCSDGEAFFEHAFAEVGATYIVQATTSVGSDTYATPGEGVVPSGAVTELNVDLALAP